MSKEAEMALLLLVCKKILCWKERRSKGDVKGFSTDFYRIIQKVVYPSPKIERVEERRVVC